MASDLGPEFSDEDVRLAIYREFADTGRAPGVEAIARRFSAGTGEVRTSIRALAAARHLAIDEDDGIVMAHPFASVPLGFSVMGHDTLWWGGCAWDSFALPHLLAEQQDAMPEDGLLVATRCPACDRALAWVVGTEAPPAGSEKAHFLVPVSRVWDDVVHTCGNQRLFCGDDCIDRWLERTGNERGSVLDLATLWRLGRGWYSGRLDHGYTRRDPSTAAAYFAEVGLTGPFWGVS